MTKVEAEKFCSAFNDRGRKAEALELVEGDPGGFGVNISAYLGIIIEVDDANRLLTSMGSDPIR